MATPHEDAAYRGTLERFRDATPAEVADQLADARILLAESRRYLKNLRDPQGPYLDWQRVDREAEKYIAEEDIQESRGRVRALREIQAERKEERRAAQAEAAEAKAARTRAPVLRRRGGETTRVRNPDSRKLEVR